jgi:thioredoxin 1
MNLPRLFVALLLLAAAALCATPWKIVLKDGTMLASDAPPLVVDGVWLFRGIDGTDGRVPADQVDVEGTARANKVEAKPRWRVIGRSEQALGPKPSPSASRVPRATGGGRSSVLTLGDSNFDDEVLRSEDPVLVDFFATWCGPCRMVAPTVDAIANQYAGRVKVGRVDVDENPAAVVRCGVHAFPTLALFKNGAMVGRIVGVASQAELARMLDSHL